MLKTSAIIILMVFLVCGSSSIVIAQDEEEFVRQALVSQRDAIILSVLYPGLGQMSLGQKLKGMSFFVIETTALALFANAHENYKTKQKKYDSELDDFNSFAKAGYGSYQDASGLYADLVKKNDDLNNLHSVRQTALIVAAGVYACNIIDALLFSPSSRSGKNAEYDNRLHIYSTIIDTSPCVMLSKRF